MKDASSTFHGEKEVIWSQCLQLLKEKVEEPVFETCFKTSYAYALQNNILQVAASNKFIKEWIESKFLHSIKEALRTIHQEGLTIELLIQEEADDSPLQVGEPVTRYLSVETKQSFLNAKFTFDTFIVGNSNHFAHAAALAVAEAPAKAYNPFFIYGGVGLGKTHLMHAIGHHSFLRDPNVKVVYLSTEKFTNELINSIQENLTVNFRNKYRSVDILLIDDIQFLVAKERTQEEFFHTFNDLYGASKQIVISSDRPPKEIPTLEDRLRSRFEWGLIADIQPPDLETREAILRKKAESEHAQIPNDVVTYVAELVPSNIRELEGALIRVIAYASLHSSPITLQLAQDALKEIIPPVKPKELSIPVIQKAVAEYFNLTVEELKANKRDQRIVRPRQIAMYICRELTDASLPHIGEEFGGKDHTTVLHSCQKIDNNLEDPSVGTSVRNIISKLKSLP